MESIRDSVSFTSSREINNPGKLNYKGGYLFISVTKKGIHIIDNINVTKKGIIKRKSRLLENTLFMYKDKGEYK